MGNLIFIDCNRDCVNPSGCFDCTGTINIESFTTTLTPAYSDTGGYDNEGCAICIDDATYVLDLPITEMNLSNTWAPRYFFDASPFSPGAAVYLEFFESGPTWLSALDHTPTTELSVCTHYAFFRLNQCGGFTESYYKIWTQQAVELVVRFYRSSGNYYVKIDLSFITMTGLSLFGLGAYSEYFALRRNYEQEWQITNCTGLCDAKTLDYAGSEGSVHDGFDISPLTTSDVYSFRFSVLDADSIIYTLKEQCWYADAGFQFNGC